jgi:glyoxylase-like metal-dependent hydrolase (beta-lactamase superfamily II)
VSWAARRTGRGDTFYGKVTAAPTVAPGVRRIELPLPIPALKAVNVYLIEGARDWSLVDTGLHTPEAEASLRTAFEACGIRASAVARTFVTHLHPDHFGMAGSLERAGSSIVMHRPEAERARHVWAADHHLVDATYDWFALHGMPHDVDEAMRKAWIALGDHVDVVGRIAVVDDGATFDLGGRSARVAWTPGHTDHHAVLFDEEAGLLFAGDHVLPRITSNVGLYSFSRDDPLGDFLASLRAVRTLPVERVLPAHGEPFNDLKGRVDELLEHHRLRLEALADLLGGAPRDGYALARALFPKLRSPNEERFALAETLAHLRHLERTGRAVALEGRPIRWTALTAG